MRTRDHRGIKAAAWFYAQPGFHGNIEAPKPADQPRPAMVPVDRWDAKLGKFVEVMVPNPEVK